MKKLVFLLLLALAIPASASMLPMATLVGGTPLTAGGYTLSHWTYSAIGTPGPALSDLWVSLTVAANAARVEYQGAYSVAAGQALDAVWSYDLTAPVPVSHTRLTLDGYGTVPDGSIYWSETLTEGARLLAAPLVTKNNPTATAAWDPPSLSFHVVKDLSLTGGTGEAHVSACSQTFDPVPEAGTLALFGLGLLGAWGVRRKK